MLNKKNIFNCLFYIFIVICIVIPCVFVTFSTSSMTSDGANFFLNALSSFSSGHLYVENSFDHRARMSVMFLNFLPLNIAYFIFKIHSLKILSYVYSSTLICLPVIFCLYSVYMFKRAEKLMTFLVVNIYIADFSKSYNDLKNELVKFAENGLFYLNEDFESFEKIALKKDRSISLGHSAETASYSIIAVNSVKNRNITKGLIIGYDKNSLSIRCDNERIVNTGTLSIAIKTEFWDLSDFKDKLN